VTTPTTDPFADGRIGVPRILRSAFSARVLGVMELQREDRGFALIAAPTRCIRSGEVHELIVTDEADARPGHRVNRCWYLGFVVFDEPGVMVTGDRIEFAGGLLGTVAGFDECHFPNHLNIVLHAPAPATGIAHGLRPGDRINVQPVTGTELASVPGAPHISGAPKG
jgi:hypothetical protein